MNPPGLILDTQLLVLFVAGITDRRLIRSHKRLSNYSGDDFDLLRAFVDKHGPLLLLPNVATEASNLLGQIAGPALFRLRAAVRHLSDEAAELYVPSKVAAAHGEFPRLGLTDSAILTLAAANVPLLPDDLDLFLAALTIRAKATNFSHLRDGAFGGQ